LLSVALTISLLAGLAGCAKDTRTSNGDDSKDKKITIKFMSNNPDRATGQGKLEQQILDSYVKDNPNVKIEVEALQDEPYKQKFKAYAAGNQLPDVYMVWGQPAFFGPVMKEGYDDVIKF
jgi:raffinose/stachyose/melibiose transport system substrate-binding protein